MIKEILRRWIVWSKNALNNWLESELCIQNLSIRLKDWYIGRDCDDIWPIFLKDWLIENNNLSICFNNIVTLTYWLDSILLMILKDWFFQILLVSILLKHINNIGTNYFWKRTIYQCVSYYWRVSFDYYIKNYWKVSINQCFQ